MTSVNGIKAGYWLKATEFQAEKIPYNYLFFGFAALKDNRIYLTPDEQKMLRTFLQWCRSNHIKAIMSIGGPGYAAAQLFSEMASLEKNRHMFVESAIATVEEYVLDGLDLAWEFPTVTGDDMSNLEHLLGDLHDPIRTSLKPDFLLSAAVYYKPVIIVGGSPLNYPACAINKYLDFVNVICFDYCDAEKCPVTCDDSRLFDNITSRSISTKEGISEWIIAGVNPDKLVPGIPLDGKKWQLKDPSKTEIGSPATYKGPIRYKDIPRTAKVVYHQTVTQYCYDGDTWITYDGTETVPAKVKYAKENHLAGYFIYDIAADANNFEIAKKASEAWDGN